MIDRKANARWVWLGLMLTASLAGAQELEFVEPVGGTVRGTVPVYVSMPSGFRTGFASFYIGPSGGQLDFKVAAVANVDGLFGFDWETQKQGKKLKDGEYRILAMGYNAGGEVVGQRALTVVVQNEIPQPARGILLRHNLTPGREAKFRGQTEMGVSNVRRPQPKKDEEEDEEEDPLDPNMFRGGLRAEWKWRVLWRNPDGQAHVRNTIGRSFQLGHGARPTEANGRFLSLLMVPDGVITMQEQFSRVPFPYATLTLEFPADPVKVGDTWRSPMTVMISPRDSLVAETTGSHTLSSIEWQAGYRCAVIDSKYQSGPYRLMLKGDGKDGEEEHPVVILIHGQRRTYFAYQPEVGRVLRIEDTQEQNCSVEYVPVSKAAEGAMEGGMEGGMPGMEGGMPGMPGMPGGGPGGPEGAVVSGSVPGAAGMEGMGGDMGAPAEPTKLKVVNFKRKVTTDIHQDFLDPR